MRPDTRWRDRILERLRSWRRPAGRPSLAGRLLMLLVLGVVVIYAIANLGLWWASTRLLEDSLQKQAVQWIAELDELGTPHFAGSQRARLPAVDQRLRNFPEIRHVRYYDARGKLLAEYGTSTSTAAALSDAQMQAARAPADSEAPYVLDRDGAGEPGTLQILAPLRVRAIPRDGAFGFRFDGQRNQSVRVIGYLDLGIDTGYYHQEFMRSMLRGSGLIAALLLLALVPGRWLVRRWLAPLTELRVPLERLARGDTSVTVARHTGHAEIEAIGAAVQQLQRQADHDLLTGLPNRGYFTRSLEQERQRLQQSGGCSALYFIDLDQFKYINDTLGHGAGDQLLVQVAQVLRHRLRTSDLLARFGGDEFMVLAHDVTVAQALELAAGINHAVNEARIVERGTVCSTGASVGIALLGGDSYTVEELVAQADMACYAAKAFGRNNYRLYEPQDAERLRMGADFRQSQLLKEALRDGLLSLHYQPMVGLRRGERPYYEALLRMPGEDAELALPDSFLPAAQRFGLLAEIDRWVIEHALGSLADARRGGRDIGISVNLSGHSFSDPAMFEFIRERLAHNGLQGGEVMFEVTEQTAVRHRERADPLMRGLLDCGCHIALDDFGAGFSSFGYLRHLPVDFVKIDGAFVRNMAADRLDQAMVRAIVDVAHTLEKRTVAEYVQDGRTVELLRRSGVDFVQGHFIGRPSQEFTPPAVH